MVAKLRHRIQHWLGWNPCVPLMAFDADGRPLLYGCKCVACGKETWFL
jgi:hypothetical protein